MNPHNLRADPHRFISYYEGQAGGSLPGFYGAPMMYGRGIGSIFARLFRFVSPLVKKGFSMAKPHLKTAASNIASDVFRHAVGKLAARSPGESQEGSGGLMVLARRKRKSPPGQRLLPRSGHKKGPVRKRKKSVGGRGGKRRKSTARGSHIF